MRALNLFLHDIYHGQNSLKAGAIPAEQVLLNTQRSEMHGVDVPGGIHAHIAGVDIVRAGEGAYYVVEDNLRGVAPAGEERPEVAVLTPGAYNSAYVLEGRSSGA